MRVLLVGPTRERKSPYYIVGINDWVGRPHSDGEVSLAVV